MTDAVSWLHQGHAALAEGRLDDAETALIAASTALPDHPDVQHLLGILALQRGNATRAVELIAAAVDRAEAAGQRRGEFHLNLGNALRALDRRDEALAAYRLAVRAAPMMAEAHNNLGVALQAAGELDAAARSLLSALALRRQDPDARYNLANVRREQSRFGDARMAYRQALALAPALGGAWLNLATLLHAIGEVPSAVAPMGRAHALWPDRPPILANLINLHRLLATVTGEDELALCRRFDRLYARPVARELTPPSPDRDAERRLRIGYVGANALSLHTAAVSILPLVEAHDRSGFEVVCYSDLPVEAEDEVSRRFRAASMFHVTHGLSDADLARRMRDDRIDIAVDILGYPTGSRLLALARRPAPVQVNLLLMGSFGLEAVGWAIGDPILTPPGVERQFSERLERIDLAFVYDPLSPTPAPPSAASTKPLTFGSLNQPAKLSRPCLEAWAHILVAVPGSRLLLKAKVFGDAAASHRLIDLFARNGVTEDRLDLRGWTPTQAGHLDVLGEIDIALDPFPYGGVISTCEALWMGVPVVSLVGDRVLGRYGAAFLAAVGFCDWAAATVDAYVATAVRLAGDRARLAVLRQELRGRMQTSRLCDGPAFARAVEAAYRRMWRAWCT